ncbi:adhesion G protein-coupled receptor E1-like [Hemiscyllium ocellatum]|uniref:adhesion G protein-coupled receptor E1-like n=1 Tax=Hemiscyllium ocellatum TaxID=170820 RepID=UPI00296737FF|nr:adhesion G protein-coupled receptor E1-like [Hemiscyllium ocellatum]
MNAQGPPYHQHVNTWLGPINQDDQALIDLLEDIEDPSKMTGTTAKYKNRQNTTLRSNDNECGETEVESSALCGTNTMCHNTLGSFYCTCKKGYATDSGETNFTTMIHCRDIDECETDPCGPNATCTNKFGHFACTCNDGFVSTTGEHTFTDKTVTQCQGSDLTVVALITYKDMDSILNRSEFHSTTGGKQKLFQLISDVVSAVITNRDNNGLDPIVNFTFKHTQQANSGWTTHCVHWDYAAGKSYWSPRGCSVGDSSGTHTQCRCNRLSTLALLMSPVGWQDYPFVLTTITLIGIPISLVCLGITIVTFAFCTNVRNALHITHMQLCVSLFLAELLFLLGINRTTNRVMCGIIAGFLHYLFLAAFVWMFLEGVQLFLMVRNIRNLRVPHSEKVEKFMYRLGYGVPAAIVVISAAVYHDGYGSPRHCWISTNRGFIWSFLGPVCLIIVINMALYFTILLILKREISKQNTQVSKLRNTRMLTVKAIAQVFILGCTWIFGLFQFQEQPGVMTYLFTIINSFQGTFIFILLCMLNPKVREAYSNSFASKCMAMDTELSEDKANPMTVFSVSKD